MLTSRQFDLMWNIEVACQKCIRAAHHFEIASNSVNKVWSFSQNCYGGISVIFWCQVFGAYPEPTHFKKLFEAGPLAGMSKGQAAERLWQSAGMNESQYSKLWNEAINARNKYLVHNDFNTKDRPVFPDLDVLVNVCLEMRNIIIDIAKHENSDDPKKLDEILQSISYFTNDRFLAEIKAEQQVLRQNIL